MSVPSSEAGKYVIGLAPITPSTSTPDYVSMANYSRLTIIIAVDNGNTVTASAITVKQATSAAGAGEKAVSFSTMRASEGTTSVETPTAVSSDTFDTDDTNAQNNLYTIEIDENDLDLANGFGYVRAGTGDAANTVLSVVYYLHGSRYQPGDDVDVLS